MQFKNILILAIVAFGVMVTSQSVCNYLSKTNNVGKFDVSAEQIAKDLDGRAVTLMLNQVWPFDASQNITVQTVSKKPMDEFVVVVVDVKALAPVQQETTTQFSTNPNSKEPIKPKLPSKLQLVGRLKLTYELIDNTWYLLSADSLTLKAVPIN